MLQLGIVRDGGPVPSQGIRQTGYSVHFKYITLIMSLKIIHHIKALQISLFIHQTIFTTQKCIFLRCRSPSSMNKYFDLLIL